MMCSIDVAANAVAHRASHEHVTKKVVAPREARDAHGGGQSVSAELDDAMLLILVCDDGRQRPCRYSMTGWKRIAPVKELSARIVYARAWTLSCTFERDRDDAAVN